MVLVKCASCFELVYEKSPLGCPRCGNPKFRRMSKVEQAQFSFVFQSAQQGVQRTGGESGQQNLFSAGEVLPAKVTRQSTRR